MSNSSPMPGADRGDHRLDLDVREHLVDAVLLAVDDLPAQRQDRLVAAVAALLGRAAGRVALDDEELGRLRVVDRAVGELARAATCSSSADLRRVSSRALRAARRAREAAIALLTIWRASVGFSSRNSASFALTVGLDEAGDRRVAELRLRLALELRVLELDRDDGGEPLAHVLALEVVLLLLQQALVARVLVQRARERRAEALHVGAALDAC